MSAEHGSRPPRENESDRVIRRPARTQFERPPADGHAIQTHTRGNAPAAGRLCRSGGPAGGEAGRLGMEKSHAGLVARGWAEGAGGRARPAAARLHSRFRALARPAACEPEVSPKSGSVSGPETEAARLKPDSWASPSRTQFPAPKSTPIFSPESGTDSIPAARRPDQIWDPSGSLG